MPGGIIPAFDSFLSCTNDMRACCRTRDCRELREKNMITMLSVLGIAKLVGKVLDFVFVLKQQKS